MTRDAAPPVFAAVTHLFADAFVFAFTWLLLACVPAVVQAATVTQTATATGASVAGKPTIASFSIPNGKNRALFICATYQRDHCSPIDGLGGFCASGNITGIGLGENWPEPRTGVPPATSSDNQITARIVGPGGTINKQNALLFSGTSSGDLRFITISTSPTGSSSGAACFSLSSFHIVLFEDEIHLLLGGAPSGTVSISFPDVATPSNDGDDALLIASAYQNVEQTENGFVRNASFLPESDNADCTFTNSRQLILRLHKALPNGRFENASDQFTLTIAGAGGPATVTTNGGNANANADGDAMRTLRWR